MKKTFRALTLLVAAALTLSACTKQQASSLPQETGKLVQAQQNFLDKVDTGYSYDLATKLSEIRSNEKLGYRTAGSQAEIATGDMLKLEMEKIGLKNVTKDEFTLDTWTFSHADLSYTTADGIKQSVVLGGYQTQFETNGVKDFVIVDGGEGTEADLANLDVQGKLVLIDINQRENWWVNYPAYEAKLHGAAAILVTQDGGYGEVSDDALNAQDICGPADAPAFSISRTDADALRVALKTSAKDFTVQFDASSVVGFDGTSYNIVGTIPGRDPDSMILMSAHYDSYFDGFQDDNAAIALMFGIAKGIVDSGYQPEKTLVFCALAAEEWGMSNTRYDWSTGAYNQIFKVNPEWVGKIMADINFELPAYSLGYQATQIRTSYELESFVKTLTPPVVEGAFPNGFEIIVPTQTWSDDFSFSIAGVPSSVTALRGDFAQKYYHSQFDNKETYDEPAFHYHHNMYGLLMLAYDACAVAPLNFSTRLEALNQTIDAEGDVDVAPLLAAQTAAAKAATAAYSKIEAVNASYAAALDAGDEIVADKILVESKALYSETLAAFKIAEDGLVRLTWEDVSVFPHELQQNNIKALNDSIDALESGDATKALDEHLYLVDNNWYAYDWSRDTYNYFTDYVLNQPADRLAWGAGRIVGHEDLFDVIRALKNKQESTNPDFTAEIASLQEAVLHQQQLLAEQVQQETATLEALTVALNNIAK